MAIVMAAAIEVHFWLQYYHLVDSYRLGLVAATFSTLGPFLTQRASTQSVLQWNYPEVAMSQLAVSWISRCECRGKLWLD